MKEKNNKYLRPFDLPVIALAAAVCLTVSLVSFAGAASAERVIIRGPEESWIFPLDANEEILVSGVIGKTTVTIEGGRAAIVASPCGGQTCVAAGALHKNGQWAACLPNRVFVSIEGERSRGGKDVVDALAF